MHSFGMDNLTFKLWKSAHCKFHPNLHASKGMLAVELWRTATSHLKC